MPWFLPCCARTSARSLWSKSPGELSIRGRVSPDHMRVSSSSDTAFSTTTVSVYMPQACTFAGIRHLFEIFSGHCIVNWFRIRILFMMANE